MKRNRFRKNQIWVDSAKIKGGFFLFEAKNPYDMPVGSFTSFVSDFSRKREAIKEIKRLNRVHGL